MIICRLRLNNSDRNNLLQKTEMEHRRKIINPRMVHLAIKTSSPILLFLRCDDDDDDGDKIYDCNEITD
ncbi:unnamed protein product [Onchocerca flexuosa]|uniref:Uncharacterized protein n=1 Tax=Onchocerca flexuosa TaxID=387005 RepID=A0A183GXQ3_9BILA|nr:unnamed protein product [Onchocerca flexuosa]